METGTAAKIHRIRLRFERDFTQLPNTWLRDKRLSRSARGLLAEIMTHDESYSITLEGLVDSGTEGRDALRRMTKELEQFGYLTRVRKRRSGGRMAGFDWVVQDPFEGVYKSRSTTSDYPTSAKPTSVAPSTVEPTPIEDQAKKISRLPEATPEGPVDNSASLCSAHWRIGRPCEAEASGYCKHCAQRVEVVAS